MQENVVFAVADHGILNLPRECKQPGAAAELPPSVPNLRTPSPTVVFQPGSDQYTVLACAAGLNEPRVRETLALLSSAQTALADNAPLLAAEQVRAAHFAIAALLPPANVRIRMSLEELKSLSGRKKDA